MFRVLIVFLSMLTVSNPAQAAKRALIIGNDAYVELPDLQKAVADATSYEQVFGELGYIVTQKNNLETQAIERAIGTFIDSVEPDDEVAFVYAGHGWSDGAANYIVGVDQPIKNSIASLRRSAIPLRNGVNGVIDDLQASGARIVLAVIDACRNNPFQSSLGRSGSVGISRGMVLVTPVVGTFTVFSAGAGEEALDRLGNDDEHPNSVFSRVFIKELSQGGSLQDIILDTAPQVAALAAQVSHLQRPAYYDGIGQRYCLGEICERVQSIPNSTVIPKPVLKLAPSVPEVQSVGSSVFGSISTASFSVHVIMQASLGLRSLAEINDHYLCANEKDVSWPLVETAFANRLGSSRLRRRNSIDDLTRGIERNQCDGIFVGQPTEHLYQR